MAGCLSRSHGTKNKSEFATGNSLLDQRLAISGRSRGITYLRFIHRLDADTTGVLLFAKNPGAMRTYSALFANRRIDKVYLRRCAPAPEREWNCCLKLRPEPS
jgi:23S rRNA-/tRNA-specific pseudouridylate synthase